MSLAGILFVGFFFKRAILNNTMSFQAESFKRKMEDGGIPTMTKGYADFQHEHVDPGNVTSRQDEGYNPVIKVEEGPWGVKRQMRQADRNEYVLPTFGNFYGKNV